MELFLANNADSMQFEAIKLWLRKYMDGSVSSKMAHNGLGYRINYGVSIVHIRRYSSEIIASPQLALRLWNSDIRECMLLATLLLNPNVSNEVLLSLRDKITNIELAEQFGFNFGYKLDHPAKTLLTWLDHDNEFVRISAILSISTFLQKGLKEDEDALQIFFLASKAVELSSVSLQRTLIRLLTQLLKVDGYLLDIQCLMNEWKFGVDLERMAVADEILIEIEYAK